ncbi:MAG: aminotransferase class V-fold PLP-dependent enzyme, partial [Firmicutes bacterium]|nr:aminotransferase class V-fold PLP-dependent enzyme [Bacillota bacterium]
MSAPLYDRLMAISEKEYPFHMPGHKRKRLPYLEDMLSLDFTEIPETDDLHAPNSYIYEAQKLMAKIYGCDESFFLVNGTSGGILAAILSTCPPGSKKKIIIANNCHISVYNALSLTDAEPLYLSAEITPYGFAGGIDPKKIDDITEKYSDIAACVITSPTYEGFVSDIRTIADKLHRKNIVFIVDEAHGAAFSLSDHAPRSAVSLGADIVIQSWHKTLPVLTQTSAAHIKGSLVNRELFRHYLNVFESTSPSFILMAVLDKCREYIEENGEKLFSLQYENIKKFRESVDNLEKIKIITPDIKGKYGIYDMDITRLVFILNSDTTGKELDDIFYKRYSTRFEMCGINHITAITSITDTEEELERLAMEMK